MILVGVSCENNEKGNPDSPIYDTIRPLDYFPAFPGSFWIYSNSDTLKVANNYEKYIYNSSEYDELPDYDTLVLPKLILNGIYNPNDTFAFVYKYSLSKSSKSSYRDYALKVILSETEGTRFYITSAWDGHCNTVITVKKDTSIIVQGKQYDKVIMTMQYDDYWTNQGVSRNKCAYLKEYYAKGVGLIKREERNYPINTVFLTAFELTKYKINK